MAKLAVFDDFEVYAQMAAAPLRLRGHEVLEVVTEDRTIDWERIVHFRPQAISVGLYRNERAFDRPIEDWSEDVLGYVPVTEMENYPAISVVPTLLTGSGLRERDVPTSIPYDLFLVFPKDIQLYVPKMEELALKVKTRRKLSGYICPLCQSRLVYMKEPVKDLFCPRCHTSVAIIDERDCLYSPHGVEKARPCTIAEVTPPWRTPSGRLG